MGYTNQQKRLDTIIRESSKRALELEERRFLSRSLEITREINEAILNDKVLKELRAERDKMEGLKLIHRVNTQVFVRIYSSIENAIPLLNELIENREQQILRQR